MDFLTNFQLRLPSPSLRLNINTCLISRMLDIFNYLKRKNKLVWLLSKLLLCLFVPHKQLQLDYGWDTRRQWKLLRNSHLIQHCWYLTAWWYNTLYSWHFHWYQVEQASSRLTQWLKLIFDQLLIFCQINWGKSPRLNCYWGCWGKKGVSNNLTFRI